MPSPTIQPSTTEEMQQLIRGLRASASAARDDGEVRAITAKIASITRTYRIQHNIGISRTPEDQAIEIDPGYIVRPQTTYLSDRIANAVRDVERGRNRMVAVSMPPRVGKSTLMDLYSPLWMLRRHPEWKIVMASHDRTLISSWARRMRRMIEDRPNLGIALARDGGGGAAWSTEEGGGVFSASVRGPLTGRGARVMIIDDPVKDFIEAHSLLMRQNLWDWWLSVALTRLEPPYLVVVVMTRWHEDDFVGRLFSDEHEGDPKQWEKISLPAIADTSDDPLGRVDGEPLLTPLLPDESRGEALERWGDVRRAVGTYTFSAMYQQRPAPARGAIFDSGWWRFWTMDQTRVTEDGRIIWLDPSGLTGGRWLDSWDMAFKASSPAEGGWVVGQRWVRQGANRYLIAQQRGRWSFTQCISAMEQWAQTSDPISSPCGHLVHERLVEDAANGPAIMDTLRDTISGLKPIQATVSKEARARAITPEVESGNVYLPHPGDPGNEWVTDLLSELRNFPHDTADDQVDSMTQALAALRDQGKGQITVPGRMAAQLQHRPAWQASRNVARAALSDLSRRRYQA